jgi:hypothetical protein
VSVAAELPLAEFDVISPALFESHGYPHELWKRLRTDELAGPVDRLRSHPVGGIKRLPIHCELA